MREITTGLQYSGCLVIDKELINHMHIYKFCTRRVGLR
jgi:hypothetical protein